MTPAESPSTNVRSEESTTVPRLHLVTTDDILQRPDFAAIVSDCMGTLGPHGALHLRSRQLTGRAYGDLACRLAPIQDETGCTLVINDRVDIALVSGARAVQLTSRSLPASDVRHIAPTLRIGLSIHSAAEAHTAHADWLIAGNVYHTASHPDRPPRGIDLIRSIAQATPAPTIAIGGIRPEHVATLRTAGAYGIAVVSGIWDAPNPSAEILRYLATLQSPPPHTPNHLLSQP